MTPPAGVIQEIGLMVVLLPMVAMLPLLVFGVWQARRVGKSAKARLRVD